MFGCNNQKVAWSFSGHLLFLVGCCQTSWHNFLKLNLASTVGSPRYWRGLTTPLKLMKAWGFVALQAWHSCLLIQGVISGHGPAWCVRHSRPPMSNLPCSAAGTRNRNRESHIYPSPQYFCAEAWPLLGLTCFHASLFPFDPLYLPPLFLPFLGAFSPLEKCSVM